MLAILLLIFAGITTVGSLVIAATLKPSGAKAFILAYNAGLTTVLCLAAVALMG